MSKTLVIKGADFSTNKVTTITFGSIPCTAFSFDESEIEITDYDPVEIGYTVTPSDTTDAIVITSSDTNVVAIVNGKLQAIGIGSCTITGVCGNYSATCDITVDISYFEDYRSGMTTRLNSAVSPNVVTTGSSSYRFTTAGTDEQATTFESVVTSGEALKAVKFPKNTAKIKVSRDAAKGAMFGNNDNYIVWTKDEFSGNTTAGWSNSIKPISEESFKFNTDTYKEFSVPQGADSVYVNICFDAAPADFDAAIQESGFMLEFIVEE